MAETTNISQSRINRLHGSYHVGNIVNNINNYNAKKRKTQFDKVTLGMDAFADYPKPLFMNKLLDHVKGEQLLLLGGNNGFNKGQLLKHVAHELRSEGIEIMESAEISDYYSLSGALEEEEKRCVIILYNLTPKVINFKIRELHDLVRKKDHIVLCSTEEHYDSWMFQEGITDSCWFPVPDKEIYAKETLLAYLEVGLQKKNLSLNMDREILLARLSNVEQMDVFLASLAKQGKEIDEKQAMAALEGSTKEAKAAIGPWFYSLSNVNKLIVIGLSFFEGAFESQVFAGFERILENAWKYRNEELRPIDYEDLIPLRYYFKIEGKVIQGMSEQQRRTIFNLAWRTHKRYILSAIPVLLQIIDDSVDEEKFDIDLFGFETYRTKIRNVLSETISDIAYHSFEDLNFPLLSIARSQDMAIQLVAANAVARWRKIDGGEQKIYDVLAIWQKQTVTRLSQIANGANDEAVKQTYSNIGGTIALTTAYLANYDKSNSLSPRITELLLKFIDNTEDELVNRLGHALEYITAIHPLSMKELLKDKFLHNPMYIMPAAEGLIKAYNDGFDVDVKNIITEWLAHCKTLTENARDKNAFGYREHMLTTIILTLKHIDYHTDTPVISMKETNDWFDQLRKSNKNIHIRGILLDAIIYLVEDLFHNTGKVTTLSIANLDPEEVEHMVAWFRKRFLRQREDLSGGEFSLVIEGIRFDSWSNTQKRPRTPIEDLLNKWLHVEADTVLRQIALKAFAKFKEIEAVEQEIIDDFVKSENKKEEGQKKNDKKPQQPVLESTPETTAFTKICRIYIKSEVVEMVDDFYKVAMAEKTKEKNIEPLATVLVGEDKNTIKTVVFLYKLFRNIPFEEADNPGTPTFNSSLFVTMAGVSVPAKKLLRAFAPLLFSTETLTPEERNVIFKKIKDYNNGWLRTSFILAKNPVLFVPILMVLFYLVYQFFNLF